ncbi:SDR family oxidoreductase [Alteribacter natronophilus]|uniref:SDR family oxidoreductase n=1 Tax=Alteribacter natronophilus TaxID=2583810 RepID=UPI00110E1B6F|nr:SDR family oxidoreductase [Alteribacter natronophilus]TMW73318.1 NAD-dependent epimerase/dehydratase family protein [Alteribacter natronophilus]
MKILVTGATGFVGKKLTKSLLKKGHAVYALVRSERKKKELIEAIPANLQNRFSIVFGSLEDASLGLDNDKLKELKQDGIDLVYHSAAYLSFDDRERGVSFDVNVEGTRHILEFSRKIGVKRFFHVSTAYTLGMKDYAEEQLHDVKGPFVNSYEESKCHAEHLVFSYKDDLDVSIFRPSIIIGDSVSGEAETTFALYGMLRSFQLFKKRMERRPAELARTFAFLCDEGSPSNFVPVDYVADVLTEAAELGEKEKIYHITNSYELTNGAIFSIIKKTLGLTNVMLKPKEEIGTLTQEELRFNEPLAVFQTYLSKQVAFDDSNTRALLKKAGKEPVYVDEPLLSHMINSYCRGPVHA